MRLRSLLRRRFQPQDEDAHAQLEQVRARAHRETRKTAKPTHFDKVAPDAMRLPKRLVTAGARHGRAEGPPSEASNCQRCSGPDTPLAVNQS